ncbi:DUF6895 family protein [Streptomyces sp. NPDC048604]|uniref:DUF6895 family protein n=1 Tax=Streptomyces sp. NPDC048604 TaxID=3365578 RepID=UPI003710F444
MPAALDALSAGALDWLGKNLEHFDPFAAGAGPAPQGRAKAALELAVLCACAARPDSVRGRLGEAEALVRTLWQDPEFPGLFAADAEWASPYALIYAALAPPGIDDAPRRAAVAGLAPGFLQPGGKTPYQRLEIRYYADRAGVAHGMEPYAELGPLSPLAVLPAGARAARDDGAPLSAAEAYAVTHAAFYLGDFGRTAPVLGPGRLPGARDLVARMLDHCVERYWWDLVAELVLTQYILGVEPLRCRSGAAAVDCLLRAQEADGSVPGRSAALRAQDGDPPAEYFRKAYHTTLVTALMALIVSSARPS